MGFIVLYKIFWRALNTNRQAVSRVLYERIYLERFFLFYDNINFYKKVSKQRVYNKNYQVAYTTRYLFFIKD